VALSKLFSQLLIQPLAAMVPHASHSVAMVVKSQLHGTGSRRLVSFQVETMVKVNFAMTTLCQNALITLLSKVLQDATQSPQLTQFANQLAKPTPQLTTLQTKLRVPQATESAVLITSKWKL
jgi:hypothetical protein